jgi:hypothetical protein
MALRSRLTALIYNLTLVVPNVRYATELVRHVPGITVTNDEMSSIKSVKKRFPLRLRASIATSAILFGRLIGMYEV